MLRQEVELSSVCCESLVAPGDDVKRHVTA